MIGIYLILNPKGKVYIGQSINVEYRIYSYKKLLRCKYQKKLYNSFVKYGVDNHLFYMLEECDVTKLNERERFWQEYFDVMSDGLNLLLTDTNDKKMLMSDETKSKIKKTLSNYFESLSVQERSEIYGKSSLQRKGKRGNRYGSKMTEEQRKRISDGLRGHKVSDQTKEKLRKLMTNRIVTWGNKISESHKGKPNLKNRGKGNKPVVQCDLDNKEIKKWNSITEAANSLSIPFNTISNNLCGYSKSGYGFIWKYNK